MCYQPLMPRHRLMFWIIHFWMWSTIRYSYTTRVNLSILFDIFIYSRLENPNVYFSLPTDRWDLAFSSCSVHLAQITAQESVSAIPPNPMRAFKLLFFLFLVILRSSSSAYRNWGIFEFGKEKNVGRNSEVLYFCRQFLVRLWWPGNERWLGLVYSELVSV